MGDVSLAGAKARLSDLVDRAVHGELVRITRRGKPVAEIAPLDRQPTSIDLRVLTDAMPMQPG